MLPLVSNALPTTPTLTSPSATASPSLSSAGMGVAGSATQQILPTAVSATPANAAYFPGTPPAKQANTSKTLERVAVPPPTGDYILVEIPATPSVTSPAPPRVLGPITLGIPQTTQLAAQVMAQQPAVTTEAQSAETPEPPAPVAKDAPKAKEAFAKARGATAYGYAAERVAQINAKPEIDAA